MEKVDRQKQIAVVTGASSGIGAATAKLFSAKGWAVVLVARSRERLQQLAAELEAAGGEVLAVPADVTVKGDVENLIETTVAHYGRIDLLVNNAGVGISGTLDTVDMDQLAYVFALNVLAPVATLQAVVPVMKAQGGGVIVNVSSLSEVAGIPFMAGYGASKAALGYLSDSAAIELSPYGIDVLKVLPGVTETEFSRNILHRGPASTLESLLDKAGLLDKVTAETVAQSIWKAVISRRQQSYVTLKDRVLGVLARFNPAATVQVLKMAIKRYAPPDGTPAKASIRRDLAKLISILASVGAFLSALFGYLIYRRFTKTT